MNEFLIELQAKLDEEKSKGNINSDIDKIQNQIDKLKIQAEIDPKTISNLTKEIEKAINQNITISNININTEQAISNAQKAGQKIGEAINQGFSKSNNAINAFKNSLSNAGKSSTEIDNIVKKVQALNVQIDSLRFNESTNGMLNIDVSGLDKFGNKVKITQSLLQDLQTMQWNVSNTTTSVVSTKELEKINNAFADYTQKLAQFKSTNTNILSGLTAPLQDFETKLKGLKNGTATIDEVRNSFKSLGTEASKITANFTGQLSKTDAAIRKLSQGDEIMDGLRASFKGLSNAPKDINTELNKVSKLLRKVKNIESSEGRTANWSAKYREWSDEVDKLNDHRLKPVGLVD